MLPMEVEVGRGGRTGPDLPASSTLERVLWVTGGGCAVTACEAARARFCISSRYLARENIRCGRFQR